MFLKEGCSQRKKIDTEKVIPTIKDNFLEENNQEDK